MRVMVATVKAKERTVMNLTKRQREIISLMEAADGPVMFRGETRRFFISLVDDHPAALIIRAYQDPELFLERRGLIVKVPMNAPGTFYRLSDAGNAVARRMSLETKADADGRILSLKRMLGRSS